MKRFSYKRFKKNTKLFRNPFKLMKAINYDLLKKVEEYVYTFVYQPLSNQPTIRLLANKFKTTQKYMVRLVEESDKLVLNIAIGSSAGIINLKKGDQIVEFNLT